MREYDNEFKPDSWEKATILLVDDDYTSFLLIEEILVPAKVKLIYASNGLIAVNMCHKGAIDLVLMDLCMPVMDGFEAIKAIRLFLPNIPIIAISACAFKTDLERCKEAGCNDYMSKPIEISKLIEMVADHLCLSPEVWC